MMKKIGLKICSMAMLSAPLLAHAEPSGNLVKIMSLRPYAGGVIYVHINSDDLCGTDMFTIDSSQVNGKEMYAAALAAVTTGKQVRLEVSNATGCAGWGTRLQSIYILQ